MATSKIPKPSDNRRIETGATDSLTVTFSRPFSSAPSVFTQAVSYNNDALVGVNVYDITTTGFKVRKKYVNSDLFGDAGEAYSWMAIGS